MPKSGPIILIDDDADDQEIMEEVIRDLGAGHPLIHFKSAGEAFDYLVVTEDQPFLIICDINLPILNRIELKKQIDEHKELRIKSIPFVFYSTSVHQKDVNDAYVHITVQGFFQKC